MMLEGRVALAVRNLSLLMFVPLVINIIFVAISEQTDIVINEQIDKNPKSVSWIIMALAAVILGIFMFTFFK